MAKIDVYLRSIERFGASGALLMSNQSVTLRFPTGDRHATQVTPHDQLVAIVREIAPSSQLAALDGNRPARFDVDANGKRWSFAVAPKPGAWQVTIEPSAGQAPAPAPTPPPTPTPPPPPTPAPIPSPSPVSVQISRPARNASVPGPGDAAPDLAIERGQYDSGPVAIAITSGGSPLLDQLTSIGRQARATDIYLACGAAPVQRIGGALQAMPDRGPLDAETLSRELGIVAPASARALWSERGAATFAYGDGVGRVRVSLARDHRGPAAALRLLVAEAPALDRLGLDDVAGWLDGTGLVLVGGPSGSGKTTTLAALVRALGERGRRVVAIEDPIEIVHLSPLVSQRAVGEHCAGVEAGVAAAMREGSDAIAIGAIASAEAAGAAIDAVAGGHLVITTIASPTAATALAVMIGWLAADRREPGRALLAERHLGSLAVRGRGYEVIAGVR